MTVFNIRTVRLQSGDQFRDVREVDLEPLELGGQRYVPIPESPEAVLTLTRVSSGLMLELEFDVRLVGPCVRCLGDAGLDVSVKDSQYQATSHISSSQLRPGDLLFWGTSSSPSSIHHVAMYLGGGMMIHAPRTGQNVQIVSMYYWIPPNFFGRP